MQNMHNEQVCEIWVWKAYLELFCCDKKTGKQTIIKHLLSVFKHGGCIFEVNEELLQTAKGQWRVLIRVLQDEIKRTLSKDSMCQALVVETQLSIYVTWNCRQTAFVSSLCILRLKELSDGLDAQYLLPRRSDWAVEENHEVCTDCDPAKMWRNGCAGTVSWLRWKWCHHGGLLMDP